MRAILSKTTTDQHKSRILSTTVSLLCMEVYLTPQEMAKILEVYDEQEFEVEIKEVR